MQYTHFEKDPTNLRLYTLANGLQVYLTQNKLEPSISTHIVVRAGHTYDPANNTGLAHYLEHMMFKGTAKIGTLNWAKEAPLLAQISDLYEKHKNALTSKEKTEIYAQIDALSTEAAQYAAAGEYDQLLTSIGAQQTNAYTSFEETVYKNTIPSNELEKWLMIESERFSQLVLRLFHTELETVYEEFNMGQDRDESKEWKVLLSALFAQHPYGTQTTIGKGEHLQNPSMQAIHEYFSTYYVPNNMAIILSGDFDYESTIVLIDQYFGKLKKSNTLSVPILPQESPISKILEKEVYGPQAERVSLAYRLPGANTKEEVLADLFNHLLTCAAGIFELNINYPQKMQYASAHFMALRDYSVQLIQGFPKAEQSLEEVKALLLQEIEAIKRGEFDHELLPAIVKNARLSFLQNLRQNNNRVYAITKIFVQKENWQNVLNYYDQMAHITPQELIDFVKENFQDNYAVVYKKQGEDQNTLKVDKPKITSIEFQNQSSVWLKDFMCLPASVPIEPIFADFSCIKNEKISSHLELINNEDNNPFTKDLFTLTYLFELGQWTDRKMALAFFYAGFLGTEKYTHRDLKINLFKEALNLSFYDTADYVYLVISGHKDSLQKGVEWLEHILAALKIDIPAYQNAVNYILQERENDKKQKEVIFHRLMNWAIYGKNSPTRDLLSQTELEQIDPAELLEKLKNITQYPHKIIYRGSDYAQAKSAILTQHILKTPPKQLPLPKKYEQLETQGHTIFVNYDMVQISIGLTRCDQLFDSSLIPYAEVFDAYFGTGLSSIVFQQIREAQSLAYRAYATYGVASRKEYYNTITAFIGTQPSKLKQAISSMKDLFDHLPKKTEQFKQAKVNILKGIAAQSIQPEDLFWYLERLKKRGITSDIRKEIYEEVQKMSWEAFENFFNQAVKGKKFNLLLMGDKKSVDLCLETNLPVAEVSLEDLFNY